MREAKQVEARLLEEVGAGRHNGSRTRTVGELLERWFEWRQMVKPISPTTVMSYRGDLDRYILPALGQLPLSQVEKADVRPPQAEDAARLLRVAMEDDSELGLFLRLAVVLGARRASCAACDGPTSTWTRARF